MSPPKSKGRGCLIWALVAIGLFVLLGVIVAIAGSGDDDGSADVAANSGVATTAAPGPTGAGESTPAPTDPPTVDQGTRENPYLAGQPQDIGDGWTVRVAGYNPNGNELVAAANMFNEDPPAGQQYVVVQIEATYSGEGTRSSFDLTFDLLGSGGVTIPLSLSMCVAPEPQYSSLGEVYPGGTLSGYACALVPSDQVPSLVLIAEPTLAMSGTKAFFQLG